MKFIARVGASSEVGYKFKKAGQDPAGPIQSADGISVDGDEEHWTANCPRCDAEMEFLGVFDSSDETTCLCGCKFSTPGIWVNDATYITN